MTKVLQCRKTERKHSVDVQLLSHASISFLTKTKFRFLEHCALLEQSPHVKVLTKWKAKCLPANVQNPKCKNCFCCVVFTFAWSCSPGPENHLSIRMDLGPLSLTRGPPAYPSVKVSSQTLTRYSFFPNYRPIGVAIRILKACDLSLFPKSGRKSGYPNHVFRCNGWAAMAVQC